MTCPCFRAGRHTPPLQSQQGVPYRRHHLLVEGERDVGTVVLVVGVGGTLGLHGLEAGGPALTHTSAGAHEALGVQDGDAALPAGALAVPFVQRARAGTTPHLQRQTEKSSGDARWQFQNQNAGGWGHAYLRAGDPPVHALAGVAVIVPLGPIRYHAPHGDARSP